MICKLCGKEITGYLEQLNRIELDKGSHADICQPCIDRFMKWQGNLFARLFPTSILKKKYGK